MYPINLTPAFFWLLAHAASAFTTGLGWFVASAAPTAVAALWQGVLVAAGLGICLRLAPRISASYRFAAWGVAFAVLTGLEILPFLPRIAATRVTAGLAHPGPPAHAWFELDARWTMAVAAIWVAAAALRALDLILHSIRLRRLWNSAQPIEDGFLSAATRKVWSKVQVCTTRDLDRPGVIGFLAPRILIPEWLLGRLTAGELEQIVLHEGEHLSRRDDWTNLLQKVCLVLFPLNPTLAWMERRLCREREMACDEGVIRLTHAPHSYAACLTSLAERGLERRSEALSLGALERRPELVARVHSILLKRKVLNPLGARTLVALVAGGLLFSSVELARCPQLVAFEPSSETASAPRPPEAGGSGQTWALARPGRGAAPDQGAGPAFRATNVVAILGPRASRADIGSAMVSATPRSTGQQRHTRHPAFGAIAAKALSDQPKLASRTAPGRADQAWVVFSAWQLETRTSDLSQAQADDSAAKTDQPVKEYDSSNLGTPSQITVTRMILAVYSADPGRAGTDKGKDKPVEKSPQDSSSSPKPVLSGPAVVPFYSGWLVIQL
jgi:BlaR1 peptidase M56